MNKKLGSLLAIIVVMAIIVVGIDCYAKYIINKYSYKAIYDNNVYTRNCSDYAMEHIINDNSIVVMGSSELGSGDELAYPPALFNNGHSDFNMILWGGAYLQSLATSINIGALQNNLNSDKIVFIISPQWFKETGVTEDDFSSRFEELNFVEFLRNKNISDDVKRRASDRVNTLLGADEKTLHRVLKDEAVYLDHSMNPLLKLEVGTYNLFRNAKVRFELIKEYKNLSEPNLDCYVNVDKVDFDLLLSRAEQIGINECTNNSYGVYDERFDKQIKDDFESFKDYYADSSYLYPQEYEDFTLFLDVCKEIGINPMIVSIPLNGRWYDYGGFPKDDRNTYYQRIRDICDEYGVTLLDYSNREYELYFLKDVMHLGWKGWVYLDKAVYDYYKGNDINDQVVYTEIKPQKVLKSDGVEENGKSVFLLPLEYEEDNQESVRVNIVGDDLLIDKTNVNGFRSGTFLCKEESGEGVVRFQTSRGNVDYKFLLEEEGVYRIRYEVEYLGEYVQVSNVILDQVIFG